MKTKTLGLSLAAALIGAVLFLGPEPAQQTATSTPFWQQHGAAPAARDAAAVADLRLASRPTSAEAFAVAAR